jgi:hypothetical protein
MEKSFSQRMGFKSVKQIIQVSTMDDALRNSLWNDFYKSFWPVLITSRQVNFQSFLDDIWMNHFKQPVDNVPGAYTKEALHEIREYFLSLPWIEVYDFIEFMVQTFPDAHAIKKFIKACNLTLERELSAYRFVERRLVPITSEQEIIAIEEALSVSRPFTQHLVRSLELLADRKTPDYRNSIKESISAVEAMCQLIVGDQKATLGKALAQLESKIGKYPHSLRNAFTQLYDFTSDAEGIRHALLGKSNLDIEDASFMLIACSAFINYLAAKAAKAGMELSQSQEVAK